MYGEVFNYDKFIWTNAKTDFTITCKKHGDFVINDYKMTYRAHPCPGCKKEYTSNHGVAHYMPLLVNKFPNISFEYFTEYVSAKTKIKCVCSIHGEFYSSIDHLLGDKKIGCSKCSSIHKGEKRKLSIEDLEKRHIGKGYKYLSIINGRVTYECPLHGIVEQAVRDNAAGKGCIKCGQISGKKLVFNKDMVTKLSEIHFNKYTYNSLSHKYVGKNPIIEYVCPIHGLVEQDYQNHLKGKGCPLCNTGFRNRGDTVPTYIYIVYFNSLSLWKLGVTKFSLSKRYSSEPLKYTEVLLYRCKDGTEAYNIETEAASVLKPKKYKGQKVLFSGNTELYTEDITETVTEIISKYQ
jgi:hypothetical protein